MNDRPAHSSATLPARPASPASRRIWVLADPHIGHVSDDRDGGDWLAMVMADRRDGIGPVDYAINLGDASHQSLAEQLDRWVELRDSSGVGPWFEIVGNHDFRSFSSGLFSRIVGAPRYWEVVDGNVAIFSLPAERGNAAGMLIPPVEAWLRERIAAHADKNIILAAHQFPYDTVANSTKVPRCLYPRDAVERFCRDVHVDLWLGGHVHSQPRTPDCSVVRNGTTFINAASASHTYNTEACNSIVLELRAGSRQAGGLCRDHDRARFLPEHEIAIRFAHPCEFSPAGPVMTPVELDVSPHYSRIDEEQVVQF